MTGPVGWAFSLRTVSSRIRSEQDGTSVTRGSAGSTTPSSGQIIFHRDVDIVSGTTVVRDLTLEIQMAPDVRLMVPTFIRYDLQAAESGWRIASLRAYWDLPVMVTEFLQDRLKSVPVVLRLCGALLRNQGISGSARYLSGPRGQGRSGKRLVEQALSDGQLRDDLRNAQ